MLARNTNVGECEGHGYPCVHGHACRLSHENGHAHVGGCAYASDWLTIRGHGSDCAHACVDANLSWHWVLSEVEFWRPSVSNKKHHRVQDMSLPFPLGKYQASVSSGTRKLLVLLAYL
jgi:hypothetical protein